MRLAIENRKDEALVVVRVKLVVRWKQGER
jgi:hypothetical protein